MSGPRRFSSPQRQRGSILVPAVIGLLVAVLLLGGAQLGYLFYVKRDMQKAADLAALSGAQILGNGTPLSCTAATTAAAAAARANFSGQLAASDISADCYHWDPVHNTADPRHLAAPAAGQRYNALLVTLSRTVATLLPFMSSQAISVQSVAARPGEPTAAFSVGTTLIATRQQPGTLINLLSAVGLNLDGTALVGYDAGLANVQITPAGLLKALDIDVASDITVGGLNSLLAMKTVSLGKLLDAIAVVGGQDGLLAANVTLVNTIKSQLGLDTLDVTLGSAAAGRTASLFAQITAPDGESALNTRIGALDLIAAAVGVATGGHAVQGGAPVGIAGLATITPAFSVIEPAQIAIGGVGATAYSAQIRVFLQVTIPKIKLLNGLLSFGVDLPIVADLVAGQGTLTDLCSATDDAGRDLATIAVTTSVLDACIGDLTQASAFSSTQPCNSETLPKKQLLTLRVGNVDMGVYKAIPLVPVVDGPTPIMLAEGETRQKPLEHFDLGLAVQNLTNTALTTLLGDSAQKGSGTQPGATATTLAQGFWDQARNGNSCAANDTTCIPNSSTCTPDDISCIPPGNSCDPGAGGADGYNCRKALWKAALTLAQNASNNLGNYVDQQPGTGLLTGVANLLTGLTGALGNALGGLVGTLLPTNSCATATILGYGGNESGCINEIAKSFPGTPNAGTTLSNSLLGLLGPLFDVLRPVLDSIGAAVLDLINNTIGLNLNSVDVKLMSLQCNGKGVQLVY